MKERKRKEKINSDMKMKLREREAKGVVRYRLKNLKWKPAEDIAIYGSGL